MIDFSAFHSRLHVTGRLHLKTALRIGAGGSGGATEQDLPVLKDLAGRPYIPGSSFKGVYRSQLERLLRGVDPRLACISVPRAEGLGGAPGCLTQADVAAIKAKYANQPAGVADQAILDGDVLTVGDRNESDEGATFALTGPCWMCRLCGAPWLASKFMVRDMHVIAETWFDHYLIRDGVAIDRDTETAAHHLKYDFEAVPAGTEFQFELVVDNAGEAELGLALLGLREFESGAVQLGGARSRGLGHVDLNLKWDESVLVTRDDLRVYLKTGKASDLGQETERQRLLDVFLAESGILGGSDHAQETA